MTAKLIPGNPKFEHPSEELVCNALREQLPDDAWIIHGQRITYAGTEAEIDLLVLWPRVGIAAIEIKASTVEVKNGKWLQGGRNMDVSPVEQVRRAKYELIKFLRRHSSFEAPRVGHFVAVPYTELAVNWSVPDAPRDIMIDKSDIESAAEKIRDALLISKSYVAPTAEQVDLIRKSLRSTHAAIDNAQLLARRIEDEGNKLTQEQTKILSLLRYQDRAQLVGGAGSGKTHLALMKAKQLVASGSKVALLCYSRGLARQFELVTSQWEEFERPEFVGLFHKLSEYFGGPSVEQAEAELFASRGDVNKFYAEELPQQLLDLASHASDDQKFDAIIVDEAQDFDGLWWDALTQCLVDREEGTLYVFADSHQTVFDRHGSAPITLNPFPLDGNLRNSGKIAKCFEPLTEFSQEVLNDDGEDVEWVSVKVSGDHREVSRQVIDAADEQVERLMDKHWEPCDIALLTTGSRHPEHTSQVDLEGWDGYWDDYFAADDVFYGHVLGFKGLERRAVVLALNSIQNMERAKQILYVGLSRARSKLVVVGPEELLREAGGNEVFRLVTGKR